MAGLLLCSTGGWCCWVITKGKYKLVWHPQKNWPVHTWYALIVSKFLICALHVASPLFFFLTSVDFCSEFKLIQWSSSTEVFLCSSSLFLPFTYEVNWSEVKWLSHVRLFATPWTVAYQAPPSMGFSRQEYWSGLPFPSPSYRRNAPIWWKLSSMIFKVSQVPRLWFWASADHC